MRILNVEGKMKESDMLFRYDHGMKSGFFSVITPVFGPVPRVVKPWTSIWRQFGSVTHVAFALHLSAAGAKVIVPGAEVIVPSECASHDPVLILSGSFLSKHCFQPFPGLNTVSRTSVTCPIPSYT